MANSPGQTTSLSSNTHEASLKACRSSNDRISYLSDALIHRILSFLPTKQAVATSVLSKRWVWIWTLVPTLDLQDSFHCRYSEKAKMRFVHFVYRVLLLNRAGSVEKFRLNCNPVYDCSCVNTWICSAIERGLQEVDICISKGNEEDILAQNSVKLPSDLFLLKTLKILKLHGGIIVNVPGLVCLPCLKILHLLKVNYANAESIHCFVSGCLSLEELRIDAKISTKNMVNFNISTLMKTLKILKLHGENGGIVVDVPGSVCFPSLEILHLLRVKYANVETINRLISGCPSLEELHVHTRISEENMVNLNISTPRLNRLSLTLVAHHQQRIEINAPALKFLIFSSGSSEPIPYIAENSPCLIEANISCPTPDIYKAVRALKGVKCLKLRGCIGPDRTYFPMFVNLTQLELSAYYRPRSICWAAVSLFVQNSPRLRTLVVHEKIFSRWKEWKLPELVPICFEITLTRACFEFEGLEEELKMAEYFLKNAIVLRTMKIYTKDLSSDSKACFLEKLSMFPRSSETCELTFV